MRAISLATAITLTDQSERTLRRRIADGLLPKFSEESELKRTMIPIEAIRSQFCIPIEDEDIELLEQADTGNAEAQNDLALLFLSHGKAETAIYWLELAAKQDYADAMHWLARCYFEGNGVAKDEDCGLMWLAQAATHGHVISQAQLEAMKASFINSQ